MIIDVDNFLHSLALWMAGRFAAQAEGGTLLYNVANAGLFRHVADEASANADLYSVLRNYTGGGRGWEAVPVKSIQCLTRGKSSKGALTRAQRLFETLLNAEGRPVQMQTIPAFAPDTTTPQVGTWRIVGLDFIQEPGLVSVDERGRADVVFNFDAEIWRSATS